MRPLEPGLELAADFRADTENVFHDLMVRDDTHFSDIWTHQRAWVTKRSAPLLGAVMDDEDGRFIDLAPYPTARSVWFSLNLGF